MYRRKKINFKLQNQKKGWKWSVCLNKLMRLSRQKREQVCEEENHLKKRKMKKIILYFWRKLINFFSSVGLGSWQTFINITGVKSAKNGQQNSILKNSLLEIFLGSCCVFAWFLEAILPPITAQILLFRRAQDTTTLEERMFFVYLYVDVLWTCAPNVCVSVCVFPPIMSDLWPTVRKLHTHRGCQEL